MKAGYMEALGLMCATMDYTNNIGMLSRMTKQLKTGQQDPQDNQNVDIFGRIEKLSYDFILRLRQHEMEHTHVTERLSGVGAEQEAIQRSIMHQLATYEQSHKLKYGDTIPDELNFAAYFQLAQDKFNSNFKKETIKKKTGIYLAHNDVKMKVLDKIEQVFRHQEKVLTQTTDGFSFK